MTYHIRNVERDVDEYIEKYFHWPSDYFPFNLPACSLKKTQENYKNDEQGMITVSMDFNLELELRILDEQNEILHAFHPRTSQEKQRFEESFILSEDTLKGNIGLTFIWTFYIPCPEYAKKHPMGIIHFEGAELKGKNTRLIISDTRLNKK